MYEYDFKKPFDQNSDAKEILGYLKENITESNYARLEKQYRDFYSEKEKMKYIPSKYNELTTQSKNRKREKFDPKKEKGKDACTMANNVLGKTSRAIPLWRQGL